MAAVPRQPLIRFPFSPRTFTAKAEKIPTARNAASPAKKYFPTSATSCITQRINCSAYCPNFRYSYSVSVSPKRPFSAVFRMCFPSAIPGIFHPVHLSDKHRTHSFSKFHMLPEPFHGRSICYGKRSPPGRRFFCAGGLP